ncbi:MULTISPECIES: hypothetical protein [Pseudomonas syringae group]|uniref:hypothetical protein n=1 Tax=Pseudomonas syringae group TaxID=136849 RepID=UPI000AEE66F1|nr:MULTISPECIES: hypothetical protein [Pseudomonas syringae group]MDY0937526.1 hypothetical protein [Pseudomonas viridiflava]MDY1014640.1 hypothetical protein [Pseudomonas viridiflava]
MSIQYGPFNSSGSPVLPPNQQMVVGQFLQSPNGRFRLELQGDGNLVIKDQGNAVWVADGNQLYSVTLSRKQRGAPWFVVSNGGFLYDPSRSRLWIAESTHSKDKSVWYHSHMSMQNDGNLVIYDQRTGDLLWARFGFVPGRFPPKKKERVWFNRESIELWTF